MINFLKTQSLF